jgi:hypothetical protein
VVGLSVDGDFAFGVRLDGQGHPLVEVDLRDLDNRSQVRVVGNQLRVRSSQWDVEFVGTTLTVRRAPRNVALEIEFDGPNNRVIVHTADMALHHIRVRAGRAATGGGLYLPDNEVELIGMTLEGGGVNVGRANTAPTIFHVPEAARAYGAPPPVHASPFRTK